MKNQLLVTCDGPGIAGGGVPVPVLVALLDGVQDAMRLLVEHLDGREPGPGQPPKWIQDQSRLRLASTKQGSFVAELTLDAPQGGESENAGYGVRAFQILERWDGDRTTLPRAVSDRLYAIPSALPDGVRVWLGDSAENRRVEIKRRHRAAKRERQSEDALLYGWLREVNWGKRTARLHRFGDDHVKLRFEPALDEDMRQLATQYVEVRGYGRLNAKDRWTRIRVCEINATRSRHQPFDLDAFLDNPNPKIFDPEKVVTASEPFDVDEFNRSIREARDVGREQPR